MSGICGWIGVPEAPQPGIARLDAMSHYLTSHRGSVHHTIHLDEAALACGSLTNRTHIHRDDRLLAVIHGAFHWRATALRAEAEARGSSATIAHRYLDVGPRVLEDLGGAFSLAIIDRVEKHVFLAVDRMGMETAYYGRDPDRLYFASKLQILRAALLSRTTIDRQALFDYLHFGFTPSPATGWSECYRLRPAEYVIATATHLETVRYWQPAFRERGRAASASHEELRHVVRSSVERNVGMTKCGAFLSGGIDSSTMVGMLTSLGRAPVPAYSLGYDLEANSEMPYARLSARFFGADHRECILTPDLLTDGMVKFAAAFGSPFGNVSAPALLVTVRAAAADGVQTMVAGDGGDELFAGNPGYLLHSHLALWDRVPRPLRRSLIQPIIAALPGARWIRLVRKAQGYVRRASMPMPERLTNYHLLSEMDTAQVIAPGFLESVDANHPLKYLRGVYEAVPARSLLNKMLGTDWVLLLAESDLPRASTVCEMAGLDVVYPLLDDAVVEISTRIPVRQKMSLRRLRTFYRGAFRDFLPPETLAKPKQGENVPFAHWMSQPGMLRELVCDSLTDFRHRGFVAGSFMNRLLDEGGLSDSEASAKLVYHIVMLELWFNAQARS